MTLLVADVGGTNSRVAMAANSSAAPTDIQHFENRNFASFYDVLQAYVSSHSGISISGCCVAMAGPVTNGTGRLTNLDWDISANLLSATLKCPNTLLLNDLTALGYSLRLLPSKNLRSVANPSDRSKRNGQSSTQKSDIQKTPTQ